MEKNSDVRGWGMKKQRTRRELMQRLLKGSIPPGSYYESVRGLRVQGSRSYKVEELASFVAFLTGSEYPAAIWRGSGLRVQI